MRASKTSVRLGAVAVHLMAAIVADSLAVATEFARCGHVIVQHGKLANSFDVLLRDTVRPYGQMIDLRSSSFD